MSFIWLILTISWLTIIIYPQIIAYLIWGLLLFFWINILITNFFFFKKNKNWKDYVSFWKYKIYKN